MSIATVSPPDLDAFWGPDGLGLTATGHRVELDCEILDCRVLEADEWCLRCGHVGVPPGDQDDRARPCWLAAEDAIRRTLRAADLLASRQCDGLNSVFATDEYEAVNATWDIYKRIVEAYRNPDCAAAKQQLTAVITDPAGDVPPSLTVIITLGRTLKRRAEDVLVYFDRPGISNGPTEAINGRLEHLRDTALGSRNLTHYIVRSLLDTGGFGPPATPSNAMSPNTSRGVLA